MVFFFFISLCFFFTRCQWSFTTRTTTITTSSRHHYHTPERARNTDASRACRFFFLILLVFFADILSATHHHHITTQRHEKGLNDGLYRRLGPRFFIYFNNSFFYCTLKRMPVFFNFKNDILVKDHNATGDRRKGQEKNMRAEARDAASGIFSFIF